MSSADSRYAGPVNDAGRDQPAGLATPARREATAAEVKALAHPLRMRIMRACRARELTNKQLADELEVTPGTAFYHVKVLANAGFLEPAEVRTGDSGALEKPYRATSRSWWLNNPLGAASAQMRFGPAQTFVDALNEAGPESVDTYASFVLHLSDADVAELDRRILAILDEYIVSDDTRRDGRPARAGLVLLHRLPSDRPPSDRPRDN